MSCNTIPAIHSILDPYVLGVEIQSFYDIGPVLHCQFLLYGVNDTYLIETASERYVLRVYGVGYRTKGEIEFELSALLHLHSHGVAVSTGIKRKDGQDIHLIQAPEGERIGVLFTYATGSELSYRVNGAETAFAYGKAVARVHTATEDFITSHVRPALDATVLVDEPLKAITALLAERPDDVRYLEALADQFKSWMDHLSKLELDRGFCHGDFHSENAHINLSGDITFFDFDCCGLGWRAYDLAVFRWNSILVGQEDSRWPSFVQGYKEIRSISDSDIEATGPFVAIRHLWLLGLHAKSTRSRGHAWMNSRYFNHQLDFFRKWEKKFKLAQAEM